MSNKGNYINFLEWAVNEVPDSSEWPSNLVVAIFKTADAHRGPPYYRVGYPHTTRGKSEFYNFGDAIMRLPPEFSQV